MKSRRSIGLFMGGVMALVIVGCSKAPNELDTLITEYEQFTDKIVEVQKKAMGGDATAATELAALGQKYQEWGSKMAAAQSKGMSKEQVARITQIAQKYAAAAASAQPK